MENNINQEITQAEYLEIKSGLKKKVCIFGICLAAFFVLFKLMDNEATIFSTLKDAFYFALVMYLPFKICYQTTGSIIGSLIGSFVLVFIVMLVLGNYSTLIGWILFGSMALEFGWSVYRLLTFKKMLTGNGQ